MNVHKSEVNSSILKRVASLLRMRVGFSPMATIIFRCLFVHYCLVYFCFFCVGTSYAVSTLTAGQVMRDYEFLESPNKQFRLRFFGTDFTSKRFLGIECMYVDKMIIWIANRENPLTDSSGSLNITQDGNMVISDNKGISITLKTNMSSISSGTVSVTLLNSGNLVLQAGTQTVWQSFDYLFDTWVPGMKLGLFGLNTGSPQNHHLTSWINPEDPTAGSYTFGVDPNNTKQLAIWKNGAMHWRSGVWCGGYFYYFPSLGGGNFNFSYFSNKNESYYTTSPLHNAPSVFIRMSSTGVLDLIQVTNGGGWGRFPFPKCNGENENNYQGCVLSAPSNCRSGDQFSLTRGIINEWDYLNKFILTLGDCKEICKKNCSCAAYFTIHSDGTGCKFSHRRNVTSLDHPDADSFYMRDRSIVDKVAGPRKRKLLIIGGPVLSMVVLSLLFFLGYLRRTNYSCFGDKKSAKNQGDTEVIMNELGASLAAIDKLSGAHKIDFTGKKDHQLPLFSFSSIQLATDHFSSANKLGQGGFGPVFKGKLADGQEIAVKRLSRRSGQGLEEFKNEVILILKLQHRNLVRVLGCCIQGKERILIYEYLPNKSLNNFLFDATKRALLDWKRRMCIIEGIAQGLLYLHKYSRLKIIHRDLKVSNILLDSNMNPKISDFGTARIFGEDESRANTTRIVGTHGYMSPEYAMDGIFSVKSDVFSFGVVMLEIVSGKKNIGFYHSDRSLNLLGYAWDLWKEGKCSELMDKTLLDEACSSDDATRYVQIGLLCVQESAADRPTMSEVLSMLSSELGTLPRPKRPAFSTVFSMDDISDLPGNSTPCSVNENSRPCSVNDVTVTDIEAR